MKWWDRWGQRYVAGWFNRSIHPADGEWIPLQRRPITIGVGWTNGTLVLSYINSSDSVNYRLNKWAKRRPIPSCLAWWTRAHIGSWLVSLNQSRCWEALMIQFHLFSVSGWRGVDRFLLPRYFGFTTVMEMNGFLFHTIVFDGNRIKIQHRGNRTIHHYRRLEFNCEGPQFLQQSSHFILSLPPPPKIWNSNALQSFLRIFFFLFIIRKNESVI